MSTKKLSAMQLAFEKQSQLLARYKKARILIIEDSAEARGMLRGFMRDIGSEHIDMAVSGQEAIDNLSVRQYDLILCDYNLGKGKDGQQVLEEARHSKYLGYSAVFIMLTAETTVEMVMGALEYQPDSYLSKPYNKGELMARLNRAFEIKIEYREIEKSFERGALDETMALCDAKVASQDEIPMRALRIKAECLLKKKDYEAAKALYESVLSQREITWAQVGVGKTYVHLKDYEPAIKIFSQLIETQPNVVESYDWLAKIQIAKGEARVAQDTLELAIQRSPKAVIRQMELAKVALSNRSYLIAEKAYRRAIMLSSNSCYKTPMNYLQYVRTLLVKIDQSNSQFSKDAFAEADLFLRRLKKEYLSDAATQFRANLLSALVFDNKGKQSESKLMLKTAISQFEDLPKKISLALSDEYISTLSLLGNLEMCENYVQSLEASGIDARIVTRLKQRVQGAELRLEHEKLNLEAMELHQKGQIMDAHARFSKAASAQGASANILLNAVGVCLELAEREDLNKEDWKRECGAYLERLTVLDRCDHRYETYTGYIERFGSL